MLTYVLSLEFLSFLLLDAWSFFRSRLLSMLNWFLFGFISGSWLLPAILVAIILVSFTSLHLLKLLIIVSIKLLNGGFLYHFFFILVLILLVFLTLFLWLLFTCLRAIILWLHIRFLFSGSCNFVILLLQSNYILLFLFLRFWSIFYRRLWSWSFFLGHIGFLFFKGFLLCALR